MHPTRSDPAMVFRFSLYGLLKNQRYFEPFFALALLERGLSFAQIGVLIAIREGCLHALEVLSGAIADAYGRRLCMVASCLAYIVSFVGLAYGSTFWHYGAAMVAYGVGDAFRTGTHKAMILTWLRDEGRLDDRTRVYGYTRSWSKIGSAVSSLAAGAFVFYRGRYSDVFLAAVVPYSLNLINLATYPRRLDGSPDGRFDPRAVWRRMGQAISAVVRAGPLRGLIVESMAFEGTYKTVKDYLQPILVSVAVGVPIASLSGAQRPAVVIAVTYAVLFALSGIASRHAHRFEAAWGGTDRASRRVWWLGAAGFALLLTSLLLDAAAGAALLFLLLAGLQNVWRPLLVARVGAHAEPAQAATVMSIEAQAHSLTPMICAPLVGWLVDRGIEPHATSVAGYWPAAALGLALFAAAEPLRRHGSQAMTKP
ncbi:MAG: MFS transporter [Myxococcales bacterium FL481]|nr:MAG: MFS transporter [Myxococcales bacterium FL481]